MPKTKKAAKASKPPKAKPQKAKTSKKVTSASVKTKPSAKAKSSDTELYKNFIASLDNLITYWQKSAADLQKHAQKKSAKHDADTHAQALTAAQMNANKFTLLKQTIAEFENNWQQKPVTNMTEAKFNEAPVIPGKKSTPLSSKSVPADWEEEMEDLSEYAEDENAENLDDIFLPLDEDELSFEGDDYSSDMMDDDN